MADVGIVWLCFIGSMKLAGTSSVLSMFAQVNGMKAYMRTKDSSKAPSLFAVSDPNLCTRDAFSNIPITSEESSRSSIKRVPHHTALFYRPFRQNSQSPSKDATKVEFAIRQNVLRELSYSIEILLRPAFLKGDDVWRRMDRSDFGTDLSETLGAVGGEVFEAPAVVREDLELHGHVN
jgi:hypothetical protein